MVFGIYNVAAVGDSLLPFAIGAVVVAALVLALVAFKGMRPKD